MQEEEVREIEEIVIPAHLHGIPPFGYLLKCKTSAQVAHCCEIKQEMQLISLAWKYRKCGGDDPLEPMLARGEISKWGYNLIWLQVDWYDQLWGLSQLTWSHVKKIYATQHIECPFTSAADFFLEIMSEHAACGAEICLQPYGEVSPKKASQAIKDAVKLREKTCIVGHPPNSADLAVKRKIFSSMSPMPPHLLRAYGLLMSVAQLKAKSSKALSAKLAAVRNAQLAYLEARTSKANHTPAFAWHNGEKIPAKRGGGYSKSS